MIELDLAELRQALGRPVSSYTVTPIDPQLRIHSVTGGVYRVSADGDSLVIKVVQHGEDTDPDGLWLSGAEPGHRNYWKREWLAFHTGLLAELPGELRAPTCLLTTEPSATECWIWMEDIVGRPGASWQPTDYSSAAFDLGTTQGSYAAGHSPLPAASWLARNWLRGWVASCEPLIEDARNDDLWGDTRLAPLEPLREPALAIWESRELLLAQVEAIPTTLVHCDFWPTNLIAADDGTTVAVDWSQVGIGAVAQDIDQLTLDPLWMQVLPGQSIEKLEQYVVPSYAAGLRHAGLDASDDQVWQWYAAAAGIHYLPLLGGSAHAVNEPGRVEAIEARWDRPFADYVADRARVITRSIELVEQALESSP